MTTYLDDSFAIYLRTELGLSEKTLAAYWKDVSDFVDFIGQRLITSNLIEEFLRRLGMLGYKRTTVRRKYMSIRCFCRHLTSLRKLDEKILDTINPITASKEDNGDVLYADEVKSIVDAIRKRIRPGRADNILRDVAIVITLYHSGLRVSELCGLDMKDINKANKSLRIRGKGNKDRIVPTTLECIESITAYCSRDRCSDCEAIFVTANGKRLKRQHVCEVLVSVSRHSMAKHTTPHALRRGCATFLLSQGMDVELVQTFLGHSFLSTTQAYLRIDDERLAEVHKRYHPFGEKNEVQSQTTSEEAV